MPDAALVTLAHSYGVATEFTDWKGRHVDIDDDTLVAVLSAMGVDASHPDEALRRHDEDAWRRALPPVVVTHGNEARLDVHLGHGDPARVDVLLEDGTLRTCDQIENNAAAREIDGRLVGEASFRIPAGLPLGYHTIEAHLGDEAVRSELIVTPQYLGLSEGLERRFWGYSAQLYSVRSSGSWGVGDFIDLADLGVWAADAQASYILTNPLHAAQVTPPIDDSPYLPASRLFLNPAYLRPELVTEFAFLTESKRDEIATLKAPVAGAAAGLLDRGASWQRKARALRTIFDHGRRAGRQLSFEAFCRAGGQRLHAFATWCALTERYGNDWRRWPSAYRDSSSDAVAAFGEGNRDVEFYAWLQWAASQQFADAQHTMREAGMAVGAITDLAVGVGASSADTWLMPDVYAQGVSVGAPPDDYNQRGQDWGQPPWRPDALEARAYEPFRAMLRCVLANAGAVRIDHILGMFRLWWIPQGSSPDKGTYVRYDHEAMIGIIMLEAQRAGAFVIGEDLGTMEDWVRGYLSDKGILGTSVLWFENDGGDPLPPEAWRSATMGSVVTHDLPPSAGYISADHVTLRHQLGLLTEPLDVELAQASRSVEHWRDELERRGMLRDEGEDEIERVVLGLHRFLCATPTRVLNVSLVDAVGDRAIQNQPGTWKEYPNWRVPLSDGQGTPLLLETLFSMERPQRLAEVMRGVSEW